jgi:hypothetical protein
VRQGASWTAGLLPAADGPGGARPVRRSGCPRRPCWCTVLVVARPDDICPEEPPAGLERSGVVAVGDTASRQATGVGRRCPACGVHPSGLGVRDPAVQPSGVRLPGVLVQSVRRSAVYCPPVQRPAVCCPSRAVSSRLVSAPVHPDASVSSHLRWWRWGPRVEEAGTRATLPKSRWPVGGGWRTRPPGWVGAAAAALAHESDQAGQAGVRRAGRGRLRGGHGAGCSARWRHPPRGWRPRAGGATTVGGRRRG